MCVIKLNIKNCFLKKHIRIGTYITVLYPTYRAVFLSGQTKQPFIRACFQARQTKGGISLWHFSTVQSVFFRLL